MNHQSPRIIELKKLAEWVLTNRRDKHGWSQAELARRVTNAGYPISQNKIHRLEHFEAFDLKRIDVEFIFWLEEVFGTKFIPSSERNLIEVSQVVELVERMKADSGQLPPPEDERLRQIYDSISSLLSTREQQDPSQ